MGPQLLLIPALFVAICATFIILHSCYHKWKISNILKKKRDEAKISLVNILQMSNATWTSPPWSANGLVKSKIRPQVLVNDGTLSASAEDKEKSQFVSFDPRNPNVLPSTGLALSSDHPYYCPPPCYEDLYGPGGAVFTFKSLTPEREEPPPPQFSQTHTKQDGGDHTSGSNNTLAPSGGGQYQYSSNNNGNGINSSCLLQVPHHEVGIPCLERRNSSAVLYL